MIDDLRRPVIVMTANAQTHEIARFMALGALGVVTKPFDPMTLACDVCALLQSMGHPRR